MTLADLQASFIAKAQHIASSLSFHSLLKLNDELSLLETGNFALIPITEPSVKINTCGRPNKSQSKHSTRRDPSSWEITSLRSRNCGRCGQRGHNQRSCRGEGLTKEERMLDDDDDDEAEDAQGEDNDDDDAEDAQEEDNDGAEDAQEEDGEDNDFEEEEEEEEEAVQPVASLEPVDDNDDEEEEEPEPEVPNRISNLLVNQVTLKDA